jgi:Integrase core domain
VPCQPQSLQGLGQGCQGHFIFRLGARHAYFRHVDVPQPRGGALAQGARGTRTPGRGAHAQRMPRRRVGERLPSYIVRDRDRVYGEIFTRRLRVMGIRDRPIAPRSPWQNGHAERLIGSLRRECLDHVVVFGERQLRQLLLTYMAYYNFARTPLNKDAPVPRAIQAVGRIHVSPILGGLHHPYTRI